MGSNDMRVKLAALLTAILLMTGCSTATNTLDLGTVSKKTTSAIATVATTTTSKASATTVSTTKTANIKLSKADAYTDYKSESPVYITLNKASVAVNGTGVTVSGGHITITKAGTYVISGTLTSGQIIVSAGVKDNVRLVLNGATISCSNSAPIYVKQADKVVISLPEGTVNNLYDGSSYSYDDGDKTKQEPSAAIFSKDSLTINGTGTLTLKASFKDGIVSKDTLRILGGTIHVTAKDDGLIGRDNVLIQAGTLSIKAGGDGIKTTNDTDKTKGAIEINGGTLSITAKNDGIQATTAIHVSGGSFHMKTGGGSASAPVKQGDNGGWGNNQQATTTTSDTDSTKAFKAVTDVTVIAGSFMIDSENDAFHSNGTMMIAGGTFQINAGDDGMHADSSLTIKNGSINIARSYEGLESQHITIAGGRILVNASDDGVNVAGGKDSSASDNMPGQNSSSNSNYRLDVTGGTTTVTAGGDGLDANGSIYMTGGTVWVNGPTENMNGALDYDNVCSITGGTLIAAGSSGMAMAPTTDSKVNSLLVYFPGFMQANTTVNVKDSSGKTVASYKPTKDYQSILIVSPKLKQGASYTVDINGNKYVTYTHSTGVTYVDQNGVTTNQGMGGGGGGRGGHGGFPGGNG